MSVLLTKQGLQKTTQELEKLKQERPAAVLDLKKAREMGDLSENGYYKAARMKLSSIDHRIRQLEKLLKKVSIIETTQQEFIEIGHTVILKHNSETVIYTIVGSTESNPQEGKISHVSPLGKVLLGKKPGEKASITLPSGIHEYMILEIK